MQVYSKLKPRETLNNGQDNPSNSTQHVTLKGKVEPVNKITLKSLTKKIQSKWNKSFAFGANDIKALERIDHETALNFWKDFAIASMLKGRHTIDEFQYSQLDEGYSEKSIKLLCLILSRNLNNLRKFILVLNCSGIPSRGFETLSFSISRNLTNLKYLSLRFSQAQLNDDVLRIMANQITTHLVHLEHFEFSCFVLVVVNILPLSDTGLEHFAQKLCINLPKLKELILCFDYCRSLSSKSVCAIATEISRHLTSLEYLRLRFASSHGIDSESGRSIGSMIGTNLANLTHLLLEFTSYILSPDNCDFWANDSLKIIAHQINQNLVNLKQLKLDFNSCTSISEEDMLALGHEMNQSRIQDLKSLTLIFFQCRGVTDKGLEGLSAGINEKWKDMKNLQMNFYLTGKIGDKGLEILCSSICKNWSNLQEIFLNIIAKRNKEITDNGLQVVGTQIGTHLVRLQKLRLDFGACYSVTDAGIDSLVIPLCSNLKGLKHLALPLHECFSLTDKALGILSQIPKNLPNLLDLDLAFTSEEITNDGLEKLVDEIVEYLPGLKSLSLNFPYCSKLINETGKRLRQKLDFIPDLDIRQIYE